MSRTFDADRTPVERCRPSAPFLASLRIGAARLSIGTVLRWGLLCQFSAAVVVCRAAIAGDASTVDLHRLSLVMTALGAAAVGSLVCLCVGKPIAERDAVRTQQLNDTRHHCMQALETMRDGLCLFDRAQRLVIATGRFTSLYGLPENAAAPGMHFEALVALIYAGRAAPRLLEPEFLGWYAVLAAGGSPFACVVDLADGRAIAVSHQPLADGGWFATHADATSADQRPADVAMRQRMPVATRSAADALHSDLRRALANDEFALFYQPMVDLRSGLVSGFEALLRWPAPQRGLLLPAAFMKLAEDSGLIVPLGAWVLRRASVEAARWPKHLRVGVNLSPGQFGPHLTQTVCAALQSSGLSPERLELDITEATLWEPTGEVIATLLELRALGIRVALDDFGGAQSSLASLTRFPFDKIKIDPSFARSATDVLPATAVVRTISRLAHDVGIGIAAKRVETAEQLEWLRKEGVDEVQGHLFSPPQPAAALDRLWDVCDVTLSPDAGYPFDWPALRA